MGWQKVACWSTKAAISLKRVKIEEKLLWRVYKKSPTLFRFFGLPPYFYFRFCLYGHRDGRFCVILPVLPSNGTRWYKCSEPCAYCRIVQICQKCQGASRGHFCDSTAFLSIFVVIAMVMDLEHVLHLKYLWGSDVQSLRGT